MEVSQEFRIAPVLVPNPSMIVMNDRLAPFEEHDHPELEEIEAQHSRGVRIMIQVLIVGVVASALVVGLIGAFSTHIGPAAGISGAILVFLVLIYIVSRRRLGKLKKDLVAGRKLRIAGAIERKEVTGKGGEASALQYFLHLEGMRFWVDAEAFDSVEEGDKVLFEYLPTSELVLRITRQ